MTATTPHLPNDPAYRSGIARPVVATGAALDVPAVSWPAVFAGATVAAALSLVLLLLGTGLQLGTMAPWVGPADGAAFSTKAILWLAFTQLAAAGTGGYIAGRLRGVWTDVQADEVFFRDTAHGLLAWSVATIGAAALLTTTTAAVLGIGAAATNDEQEADVAQAVLSGGAAMAQGGGDRTTFYYVDRLFRPQAAPAASAPPSTAAPAAGSSDNSGASGSAATAGSGNTPAAGTTGSATAAAAPMATTPLARERFDESTRIFERGLATGTLDAQDETYLAGIVASHSGIALEDARRRVGDTFNAMLSADSGRAGAAAPVDDNTRANAARNTLWMVVALLIGAFTASLCALAGGLHQRRL